MNAQLSTNDSQPVSLGDWIVTLIVLAIPLVGLIMLFVWALGGGANISKRNYCRAVLILFLIIFGLLFAALMAGGISLMNMFSHY